MVSATVLVVIKRNSRGMVVDCYPYRAVVIDHDSKRSLQYHSRICDFLLLLGGSLAFRDNLLSTDRNRILVGKSILLTSRSSLGLERNRQTPNK